MKRALSLLALAAAGCVPPPPPPPPPPPAKVAAPTDPCDRLRPAEREPPSLKLDGSEQANLVASCARTHQSLRDLSVDAASPDLSALRPVGFSSVHIDMKQLRDPTAALATLPPLPQATRLLLTCAPGRHIAAANVLEKVAGARGADGPCVSFELHRGDWFGKTRWTIQLRPHVSREDFDALVGFARTHPTRFTLTAASAAWADALAGLALPPEDVGVWCREDDTAVDVSKLGELADLRQLSISGPCTLQNASARASPPRFGSLRRLSWYSSKDESIDLRGISVFAAATTLTLNAKAFQGGAELAALTRLEELWIRGTLDAEPSGKKLRSLRKLGVSNPPPAFIADLPALAELSMDECAPVKSAAVRHLTCKPPASAWDQPGGPAPSLDLRGLSGLSTLHLDGPCLSVTSPSLGSLWCTLLGPVRFQDAPHLTGLALTLGPNADLSPLAHVHELRVLTITSQYPRRISLAPLGNASRLETLNLAEGCFSDIDDLYRLPKLTTVSAPRAPELPPGAARPAVQRAGQDRCPAMTAAE